MVRKHYQEEAHGICVANGIVSPVAACLYGSVFCREKNDSDPPSEK